MIQVNRKELLHRLLCVEPGMSNGDSIQQSDCIIFKKGRFYTMSNELACSIPSKLPIEFEGAVPGKKVLKLLKETVDEEIYVGVEEFVLTLKAKKQSTEIPLEKPKLPIEDVELPKDWQLLDLYLAQAINLVHRCTKRKAEFIKECLCFGPTKLEATDNTRMIRYWVKTFVKEPVLVRGSSLKEVVPFGMTKGAETENWLHFRNPTGLRISVHKFEMQQYFDLTEFLKLRGQKVELPKVKSIEKAVIRASLFLEEEAGITVTISKDGMSIGGKSVEGSHTTTKKIKYDGPTIGFMIPPKLLTELVDLKNVCEVTECSLRIAGENFVFATPLELLNGKADL